MTVKTSNELTPGLRSSFSADSSFIYLRYHTITAQKIIISFFLLFWKDSISNHNYSDGSRTIRTNSDDFSSFHVTSYGYTNSLIIHYSLIIHQVYLIFLGYVKSFRERSRLISHKNAYSYFPWSTSSRFFRRDGETYRSGIAICV